MASEYKDFELNDPELEALATTLRENRPAPDPGFSDRLDKAVDDHFPREWSEEVTHRPRTGFLNRVREMWANPRRLMLPATAGLAGLVVVAVVVSVGANGLGDSGSTDSSSSSVTQSVTQAESGDAGGSTAGSSAADSAAQPEAAAPGETYERAGITLGPKRLGFSDRQNPYADSLELAAKAPSPGKYAAGTNNRKVAQDVEITLGTKPEDVQDVSNDIVKAVDDHNGIVLDSSVEDGPAGQAGASFSLMIPSAQLESAVKDLSGIADLKARSQETEDITAPTLTVQDSLRDSRARIDSLVKELSEATSDEERAEVENQLGRERRQASRLNTRLNQLDRRASLTPVAVTVQTGGDSGSNSEEDNSAWGIGDAFDDAGRMLGVSAGVALIALAIAIPIGLMVLLALTLNRAWINRSRRRILEES